ncbi:hypothetical protein [Helicobacter typhlonius]
MSTTTAAAANIGGGQFAYLVDSDGQNLKLYLGISNNLPHTPHMRMT